MIKPHDLSAQTREWLSVLSQDEASLVLDMATNAMLEVEMKTSRARLGENGAVELTLKTILYFEGKGNCNGGQHSNNND